MKKNVIKTTFAAVCVVAAGMGGFKAYSVAAQSDADMLLAENVEALSQEESNSVPNGTINKIDPASTKTCYSHYVDYRKYETRHYIDDKGKEQEYKVYYNSYRTYTVKACRSYQVKEHFYMDYWENCPTPKPAECRDGDRSDKPNPFSWYE